jgi:hypothetical protein
MRKTLVVGAIVVVVIATALTISFAGDRTVTQPMRLHVIELAQTDKVINTGKRGDTSGDLLTFHNAIVNTNGKRIGHDQGDCVRISPKQGSWECRWMTFIAGRGRIMVEGPFYDSHDSTFAVTGGTQEFRNVRGSMKIHARPGGFDFVFELLP